MIAAAGATAQPEAFLIFMITFSGLLPEDSARGK
jgi:hypothetical protein